LGGAIVIEEVFALPGMGRLALYAIYQRDYSLIQGIVLIVATSVRVDQPGYGPSSMQQSIREFGSM
jgi:ABC-type antimicrobial peptide transport system permease subunit